MTSAIERTTTAPYVHRWTHNQPLTRDSETMLTKIDSNFDRLARTALFSRADDAALTSLSAIADEATIESGETLIRRGQPTSHTYIVVFGSLDVLHDGQRVATIGAGKTVGELGMFGIGPASATVVANEATSLLVLPNNRMARVLGEVPSFSRAIAAELARRLHATNASL